MASELGDSLRIVFVIDSIAYACMNIEGMKYLNVFRRIVYGYYYTVVALALSGMGITLRP